MKNNVVTNKKIQAMKKKGIRKLIVSITLSLLLSVVAIATLFFVEQTEGNTLFTREAQPVWFWGLFAIFLIAPLCLFKIHRLILNPSYCGEVVEVKDGERADVQIYNGPYMRAKSVADTCTIVVKTKSGFTHRVEYQKEAATVARETYHVGDKVYHYVFSDDLINLTNENKSE